MAYFIEKIETLRNHKIAILLIIDLVNFRIIRNIRQELGKEDDKFVLRKESFRKKFRFLNQKIIIEIINYLK